MKKPVGFGVDIPGLREHLEMAVLGATKGKDIDLDKVRTQIVRTVMEMVDVYEVYDVDLQVEGDKINCIVRFMPVQPVMITAHITDES